MFSFICVFAWSFEKKGLTSHFPDIHCSTIYVGTGHVGLPFLKSWHYETLETGTANTAAQNE